MYEGQVKQANPFGFGRLIDGVNNFNFVGYFKSQTFNNFTSTMTLHGAGAYFYNNAHKYSGYYCDNVPINQKPPEWDFNNFTQEYDKYWTIVF